MNCVVSRTWEVHKKKNREKNILKGKTNSAGSVEVSQASHHTKNTSDLPKNAGASARTFQFIHSINKYVFIEFIHSLVTHFDIRFIWFAMYTWHVILILIQRCHRNKNVCCRFLFCVYFIRITQEDNDLFDSFGYYVYSIYIKHKTIRYIDAAHELNGYIIFNIAIFHTI